MHIRLVVYTLLTYPHRYVSRLTMVVLLGHIKFNRIERLTRKPENKSEIRIYSKASRYTALRSTDLGDTRFLIGSQNT